jgi:hypothetical protein
LAREPSDWLERDLDRHLKQALRDAALAQPSGKILRYKKRVVLPSRWNPESFELGRGFIGSFPRIKTKGFAVAVASTSYESPVGIMLFRISKKQSAETMVGRIALNFAKVDGRKMVLIETIQGRQHCKAELDAFSKAAGMPWANFLVKRAVEHAQKCGFEAVGIINPKYLYWYHHCGHVVGAKEKEVKGRMMDFYRRVASNTGFDVKRPVSTEHADYWVLEIAKARGKAAKER